MVFGKGGDAKVVTFFFLFIINIKWCGFLNAFLSYQNKYYFSIQQIPFHPFFYLFIYLFILQKRKDATPIWRSLKRIESHCLYQ